MLVEILNGIISLLYLICYALTFLLPTTPFKFETIEWGPFGKGVGLFFPIEAMMTHFAVLLSAFLIYYAIRWLMRMIKMVR